MGMLLIVHAIAVLVAWAGSQGALHYRGLPVFALCAALVFVVQWLAFVPAYRRQTEAFFDLTGSLSFIGATLLALLLSGAADSRSVLLAALVLLWALRLGTFLVRRIHQDGADSRFDAIKPSPLRFLTTWCLQGLWVLLTAGCALAAICSGREVALGWPGVAGAVLWGLGFVLESVADAQKRAFRRRHGAARFIDSGLWALSRHPNYLGEILLWCGVALLALPALAGWQHLTLVSPLFVYLLLTRVSGVPLLERKADRKWGGQPDYEAYKAATPLLWPTPWRR